MVVLTARKRTIQTQPGTPGVGPFEHTWSLSVEEQFYLTWPLIFVFVLWRFRGRFGAVALTAVAQIGRAHV